MASTRRTPLAAVALTAALLASLMPMSPLAAIEDADGQPIADLGVQVELEIIATVPDNSFGTAPRLNMMTTLGQRLFVVEERDGIIYELIDGDGGRRNAVEFFDVGAAIEAATDRVLDTSNLFHGGLRSLAFHPDFATNGLLYVSAMETRPSDPGTHHYLSDAVSPIQADSVLIEFTYDHDAGAIESTTYREVFRVGMPVYDHPIKQIAFDPEATGADRGLLFIGHGDGSVQSAIAGGGQNNDALGKVLRIDPRASGGSTYTVPSSNPFVGDPTMLDEVYSLGHRNPHHLSFADNPMNTSRLLIVADPGRDNVEELNLITPGADFGWPQREGAFVHLSDGGRTTGIEALPSDDADQGFAYPAALYLHTGAAGSTNTGEAIAGGYVVENESELNGDYFFADFPTAGQLFHTSIAELASAVTELKPGQLPSSLTQAEIGLVSIVFDHDSNSETAPLARTDLRDVFDDAATYETARADVRLGQGPDGELYIMSKRNNTIYVVTNSVAPSAPRFADDQILRLYRAALGRAPDEGGLRFCVDRYQSGESLVAIAAQFIASPEFGDRFGPKPEPATLVALLYENVLDRPGDADGTAFWLEELSNGATAAVVVAAFADSTENIERTRTSSPLSSAESKLLRLYGAALGRTPDAGGLGFWVDRFNGGQSLESIATQFRTSPEFTSRFGNDLDDSGLVGLLYENVLGRPGDATGVEFWLDQLTAGVAPDGVLVSFSESSENIRRTNTRR